MRWLLLLALAVCTYPQVGLAGKKVLLSSVQTLTLQADKFTTGRRSSPIAQLRCIGGKSACKSPPSAVQCYNQGSDGIDVQWKCEAQLSSNVQFDTLQVQCEGYDYPDDPYILAGSCGLTYSLKPAATGASGGGGWHSNKHSHKHQQSHSQGVSESDGSYSSFFVVVVVLISAYAIYAYCLAPSRQGEREHHGPTAPPPYSDAPPPYTDSAAPQYGFRPEFTGSGQQGKYGERPQQQQQQDQHQQQAENNAGQPGFWTGAGLGAVAGYLFGANTGRNTGGDYGYNRGGGSSYCHGNTPTSTYSRDASYSSSSSSASDSSPVTRTGYASTRRR